MDGLAHQLGGGGRFLQLQIGRAGDIDQRAVGTLDAFFQQRRADGDFSCLGGAILASCGTDAEQCGARATQNSVDIVEVDVNVRVRRNQVGDALHAGQQGGVGGLERIDDADGAIGKLKQSIVRNHDQRIDFLAQILNAKCCGSRTLGTFKAERAGNHRNGQGTLLMRGASHDRACTGTGATTLTAGHEHHIGTLERFLDIGLMILSGLGTLLRVGTCAKPAAGGIVQGDLDIGVGTHQVLRVSIDRNEFNTLKTLGNHAIDGITASSTNTDNLDIRFVVEIVSLGNLAHHSLLSLAFTHNFIADTLQYAHFSPCVTAFFHFFIANVFISPAIYPLSVPPRRFNHISMSYSIAGVHRIIPKQRLTFIMRCFP